MKEKAVPGELHSPVSVTASPVGAAPALTLPPRMSSATSCTTVWEEEEEEAGAHCFGGKEASDDEFEEEWPESPHGQFVATREQKRRSSRELASDIEASPLAERARNRLFLCMWLSVLVLVLAALVVKPAPQPEAQQMEPRPTYYAHWLHDEYFYPHLLDDWHPIGI